MDINSLNKRFEIWKHILFINIGASAVLLAIRVLDAPNFPKMDFPGWYGVWFVVQMASLLPGFVLLWGKHWMQIPLPERLNTIFGYFVVAWITLSPFGLTIGPDFPGLFNSLFLGCAVAIAVGYWRLRRKSFGTQNEMFP